MPKVGKKTFAYTKTGMKKAAVEAKKTEKKITKKKDYVSFQSALGHIYARFMDSCAILCSSLELQIFVEDF